MILTGEDGKQYETIGVGESDGDLIVKPLPQPPAKETYFITLGNYSSEPNVLEKELDLTPPQAEALAKAIEALLAYVQNPHRDSEIWGAMDKATDKARHAIRDGSAA